jgi:tetrahydromethanopterin S-methyltransferase subunit A
MSGSGGASGSSGSSGWPVVAGTYEVGDLAGPVAVCTLTSEGLVAPMAGLPGVAIAGKVYTANLGITRIVVNVTANPAIRFLLICGKDSPLFRPGQSLVALSESGMDEERRIIGAAGYEPVLPGLAPERVARFRRQVEVLDWTGEEDAAALAEGIRGLVARSPGRFVAGAVGEGEGAEAASGGMAAAEERFTPIRPGGVREPLHYDPKGYFVITLDREEEQIVLRRYLPDHTPAHEMRGRSAGPMLLGLLREGLVSQLSHAGYLGEELAKAQAALGLGLRYDQDRPLRPREGVREAPGEGQVSQDARGAGDAAAPAGMPASMPGGMPAGMPPIAPSLTWAELQAREPGATVDAALAVSDVLGADALDGTLLEPDEAEPFGVYRRTTQRMRVRWTPQTRIVMGGPEDVRAGALVRAHGTLGEGRQVVDAERLVILTQVARIVEET